jgi:uroporphyrinogen-III decarboxylase
MFLNIGFSYQWWNKNYGFEFDEKFYLNPERKLNIQIEMDNILKKRFPQTDFWNSKSNSNMVSTTNLAVEPFGHRFFPAMFSCKIRYSKNQTPWAEDNILSEKEIEDMPFITIDEFKDHKYVKCIVEQTEKVKSKFGYCSSQQNFGSVINTGMYLRGMNLFYDFYENSRLVHKLFSLITNMMVVAYDYFSEIDNKKSDLGIGNCSVAMLSPEIYKEFNYKYDKVIMEKAKKENVQFGIHQDSDVTSFIEVYKPFEYLHSFDIGWDTKIRAFRKNFPNIDINIFLYTNFLINHSVGEIHREIRRMIAEGAPIERLGFTCGDIDDNIEDEKVIALYDAVYGI